MNAILVRKKHRVVGTDETDLEGRLRSFGERVSARGGKVWATEYSALRGFARQAIVRYCLPAAAADAPAQPELS